MKRLKRFALTLLGTALLFTPALSSCSGDGGNNTNDPTEKEASVKSIAVTTNPTKTEYESGDVFDPTGMVVTATMSDGTTKEVTDYTYSKLPLSASDKQVKITYKGKIAYVSITVKFVVKATSISIEEYPTKMTYVVGEKFDPTGMKVVGIYNDSTKKVITDYDWDKKDALTLTDTEIKITYLKLSATLTIKVEAAQISGIEITTLPTKLAYVVGEKFDSTGMVVSTVTNDGKKTALSENDYTIDKTEALTASDKSIKVTYQKYSASFKISVSASALTGLRVASEMTKKVYWEGDKLDTTGLEVYATYQDGTERALDKTEYDIDKSVLAKTDTEITVSFGGFKQTIAVTVKEKVVSVNVDSLKTVRVEAEHLDTSKAALRGDFIAAGRTFIEAGDGASNGQNICGYNPGSIFEIPLTSDKDFEVIVTARMSDTELNYKINDGVKFSMDGSKLTANDVTFTYEGKGDYWNWKDVFIGRCSLKAGSHMFQLEAINQRPNLDCFDFTIVTYGDQKATKEVTGIKMTTPPTKLTYTAGETFDPTGMVIEATYSDYTSEVITDYTIDKTAALTEDDEKVTVSYGGFTIDINIQVGKLYTAKLNALGEKKIEAETLDMSQLKLRSDMQAAGFSSFVIDNSKASGGKSIERYDIGSKITMSILASDALKTDFTIAAADNNGATFDSLVTVKLDDKVITSNNPALSSSATEPYYNWQEAVFSNLEMAKGDHEITIEFTSGKPNLDYVSFNTKKYGTESLEHELSSLEIVSQPTKTTYFVGDTFDPTGMVVNAVYSDGEKEAITDYTIDKTGALTADDTTITISYQGKTATVSIKITSKLDFEATEAKTYKVEAEDLDLTTLLGDSAGVGTESCGSYGNGTSVGHIAGGYLDIAFSLSEEMNLVVNMNAAKYEAVKVSEIVSSFEIDGTTATYDDITLGKTDGNDWFNFKAIPVTCGKLSAGKHRFRVNFKAGPNLDSFDFVLTK